MKLFNVKLSLFDSEIKCFVVYIKINVFFSQNAADFDESFIIVEP